MRLRLALLLVAGCNGAQPGPRPPTWHEDVAPVVTARCAACHTPDGIGPFSLTDPENARRFAPAMVAQVKAGLMPPWHAEETPDCKPRFSFQDDPRLTDAEKDLLERWALAGAPLGEAKRAAKLPPAPTLDLQARTERVSMSASYAVKGNRDLFRCFPLPYEFPEESWLTGVQVVPGNGKVVHHVLVWLDPQQRGPQLAGAEGSYQCFGAPGFGNTKLLGAWAPGAVASETPPDAAIRIPKGSRIVINVHYHPNGKPELDLSSIDLRWTTTRPRYEALLALPGNAAGPPGLLPGPGDPTTGPAFLIPPGAREHTEAMDLVIPRELVVPARIFAVATHMHYVGTGMRVEIDRSQRTVGAPAGEPAQECLLETPRWDFHWQRGYSYQAPFDQLPTVQAGDVLRLRCRYDNSMQNRFVAAALAEQGLNEPREVRLGEQTLDEMCLAGIGIAFPVPPAP